MAYISPGVGTIETLNGMQLGVSDHSASAMDCCTPLARGTDGRLGPIYAPVWEHMLTDQPHGPAAAGMEASGGGPFGECGCLSFP